MRERAEFSASFLGDAGFGGDGVARRGRGFGDGGERRRVIRGGLREFLHARLHVHQSTRHLDLQLGHAVSKRGEGFLGVLGARGRGGRDLHGGGGGGFRARESRLHGGQRRAHVRDGVHPDGASSVFVFVAVLRVHARLDVGEFFAENVDLRERGGGGGFHGAGPVQRARNVGALQPRDPRA